MSKASVYGASNVVSLKIVSYLSGLTTLAVVLKIFELPYPPAPFLKYDVSGIPLALMAFISLRYAFGLLPLYYIASVALGFDVIGMAMKCLSEASTFAPLTLVHEAVSKRVSARATAALATTAAFLSRAAVMSLANYVVTPYWLVWAGWAKDLEWAKTFVIIYMPHIAIFNLTLALIVAPVSITVYAILKRSGYLK